MICFGFEKLGLLGVRKQDIKKALEIDPDSRDVKLESKILKEKVREYNKKDAQFYGSIFAKMNKLEQARSALSSPAPTFNTPQKQEPVPMIIDSKV
nr:peptidyl-prolyl cis-trans isomerase fkbp62 [Quercus suber]